jgi:hypothetical protein
MVVECAEGINYYQINSTPFKGEGIMCIKRFLMLLLACGAGASLMALNADYYGYIETGVWWTKTERFYANPDFNDTTQTVTDSLPLVNLNFFPSGAVGLKLTSGKFNGCIELGINECVYDATLSGNSTYLRMFQKKAFLLTARKWYGEWHANDYLTLLLGRDYTPANFFPSSQGYWKDNSFNNVGCLYAGRIPMFQASIHNAAKSVEGKVAVMQVDTTSIVLDNRQGYDIKYLCETKIPKIEGSFGVNYDVNDWSLRGKIAGGYETYTSVCITEPVTASKAKVNVDSWVAGADVGVKIFKLVSLSCDFFYGQNIGSYGVKIGDEISWWRSSYFLKPFYPVNDMQVDEYGIPTGEYIMRNGKAFEIALIASVSPLENLLFEGGWGTIKGSHDYSLYKAMWSPTYAWYFQTRLTVQKILKIAPEVGQFDWGPRGGFGRTFYFGVNACVDFE